MIESQYPSSSKNKKLSFILGIVLAIFLIVVGFGFAKEIGTKKYFSEMAEPALPVTVQTFTPQNWTPELHSSATIRPHQGVMLQSQISGVVSEILATPGQIVNKGDILVRLDSSVENAQLNASKAELASVERTYRSYEKLFKTKSVSTQELANAKAKYDSLLAQIKAMEATINRRQIIAPFKGVTGIVNVNKGQLINVGTNVVRVEDHEHMRVDFGVAEKDLNLLRVGQIVEATTDSYPNKVFSGKIVAIDPAVDPSTGLIQVQALFVQGKKDILISGMFVKVAVKIKTETEQFVVPQVAVSYNMYGNFLYVLMPLSAEDKEKLVNNDKFPERNNIDNVYRVKQVPITVLDRQSAFAHIAKDAFKFGEKFVVGGMQRLTNNALVVVKDKPAIGVTKPANVGNL